jgi:hypothetical protein
MSTATYYTYDNSHRLASQYILGGEAHYYSFNQRNMLTQIQDVGGPADPLRTFVYNGLGERVVVTDNSTASPAYWSYDGSKLLQDKQKSGAGLSTTNYRNNSTPQDVSLAPGVEVGLSDASAGYPAQGGTGSVYNVQNPTDGINDFFEYTWFGEQILATDNFGTRPRDCSGRDRLRGKTTQEIYFLSSGAVSIPAKHVLSGGPNCGPGEDESSLDWLYEDAAQHNSVPIGDNEQPRKPKIYVGPGTDFEPPKRGWTDPQPIPDGPIIIKGNQKNPNPVAPNPKPVAAPKAPACDCFVRVKLAGVTEMAAGFLIGAVHSCLEFQSDTDCKRYYSELVDVDEKEEAEGSGQMPEEHAWQPVLAVLGEIVFGPFSPLGWIQIFITENFVQTTIRCKEGGCSAPKLYWERKGPDWCRVADCLKSFAGVYDQAIKAGDVPYIFTLINSNTYVSRALEACGVQLQSPDGAAGWDSGISTKQWLSSHGIHWSSPSITEQGKWVRGR